MRRTAIAGAVLVCAASIFAGCGSDSKSTDGGSSGTSTGTTAKSATTSEDAKATVTFTSFSVFEEGYKAVLANFEEAHPNITVDAKFLDFTQLSSTLPTQMAGGSPPDLLYSFPGSLVLGTQGFAKPGKLLDLSDSPWVDRIIPAAKPGVSVEGKTYAWPLNGVPFTIVYNKGLFEELGLTMPTTFDEFLATCKASAAKGVPLVHESAVPSGLSAELIANWVDGPEPDFMEKRAKGEVTFADSSAWKTALQKAVDMKDADCFQTNPQANPGRDQSFAAIVQRKAVGLAANTAAIGSVKAIDDKIDMQLMALPGDTADATYVPLTYPDAISVSNASKNAEAARTVIDFFAEPEQGEVFAAANNALSPQQLADGEWPAIYDPFRDVIDAGRITGGYYLALPNPEVNVAFATGIVGLWTGQKDIPAILKDMDVAYDKGAA